MPLFDLMDSYIHASDKYMVEKQEIVKEKHRSRKQRLAVEDRTRRNIFISLRSEKHRERDKDDRITAGLEEVLVRLSMADRMRQSLETKTRSKKNMHAHPGL